MRWFENSFGVTASSNSGGYEVGEKVEYYSVSVQQWIPAKILKYDSVTNTYNLDCKPEVTPDRIRRPQATSPVASPSDGNAQQFPANADVEYYSASVQTWIPAVIQSFNPTHNLYDLNVKPQVSADRIRWPVDPGVVPEREYQSQASAATARTNLDMGREGRKEPARVSFSGLAAISESSGNSPQMNSKDFSEHLLAVQREHEEKYRELEEHFRAAGQEKEELEYKLKIAERERERCAELESKLEAMERMNAEGHRVMQEEQRAMQEGERRYDESERKRSLYEEEVGEMKKKLERAERQLAEKAWELESQPKPDLKEIDRMKSRCQQLVESKRDMEEDLLEKESRLESALIRLQLKEKEIKALHEGFQRLKDEEQEITNKLTQRMEENRKYILA